MIEVERDTEVLSKLLKEYTVVLRGIESQRESIDSRGWLSTIVSATGFGFAIFALMPGTFVTSWSYPAAALIAGVLLFAAIAVTAFLWTFGRRRKLLNEEIAIIAHKLENIVRVASQHQEHAPTSFGSRLELDLRRIEAEGALKKASRLLGRRNSSYPHGDMERVDL